MKPTKTRQDKNRTYQQYVQEKCKEASEYIERDIEADAEPCIFLRKTIALPFRFVSWVLR